MEKGLYGKTRFWTEKHLILHGSTEVNQNPMIFPEAHHMRVVAEITGNLAACVGNLVVTIKGKLYGVEIPIDTLTVVAAGLATVLNSKVVDIQGLDEITGSATYTDIAGRGVTTQIYIGSPYKA